MNIARANRSETFAIPAAELRTVLERLVALYEAKGEPDAADRYRAELEMLREELLAGESV